MTLSARSESRLVLPVVSGPGRLEAGIALTRAFVLVFSGVGLALSAAEVPGGFVVAHLLLAAVSVASAVPLARLGPAAARRVGMITTGLDVLAVAAYAVAVDGRPGLGSLYVLFVVVLGPLRWGLPGVLATGVPVGLVSATWPTPDVTGAAPGGAQLWLLLALITLPAAALSEAWRRSGARLRQAQSQFEAAFEHASIGMALLDPELQVLQANPSLAGLLGTPIEAVLGSDLCDWAAEEDRAELVAALRRLTGTHPGIRAEVRFVRADGEQRWGLVAASWLGGSAGVPPRIVAQVENVTDRKNAEERLSHLAQHDALTGLANRPLLLAHLDSALQGDRQLCVVFLDLDRFKIINDGLGHAAGDRLLQEVAARLRTVVRPGDVVARLGGDEFVVLSHGVHSENEALAVAERVLAGLRPPVELDARSEVVVAASAGVAVAEADCTAETLLRDADAAMYAAKAAGGGKARVFTPDLHHAARRTHELERDLRRALTDGALTLTYQPIVDLATGRVTELEALLRWEHPERGAVSPADFVPVAEQSSLIDEIGNWVLDRALQDAALWPEGRSGRPGLAVNVSPRQLLDSTFPGRVVELLAQHDVDAARLTLEVTETALVEDTRTLVPALRALRDIGVRLAIDDFGTGHASLTYLAQLPVDVVKVDSSFVAGVADEAGSAAIVGGVVAMASAFALTVVAEGVETAEQLHQLRRLGVDRVQGFLLARPMIDGAVHAILNAPATDVPAPRTAPAVELDLQGRDIAQKYRLLLEAARDITGCVDLTSVMETTFAALRRLVSFTGGSIQLVDGDVVRLAATDPPATPEALAATLRVGEGVSGGIAATGEPRYLPDITISAAVSAKRRRSNTSGGVRSWYGVPLVAEGRVIGVLQIDSTTVDAFSDEDRLILLSFASVVASAVQTARLFAEELGALQRPTG